MRWAFGVVSILLAAGLVIWMMAGPGGSIGQTQAVLEAGRDAEQQVQVIAGNNPKGDRKATETATYTLGERGGRVVSIIINTIEADGAMALRYGLQPGDAIIEIGPLLVADFVSDEESAESFLLDAYGRGQALKVRRGNAELKLNAQSASPLGSSRVPSH
jgi:hypothetical protein